MNTIKTHLAIRTISKFTILRSPFFFLVIISLIGLIVRLWGIWHGMPYEYDLDEHKVISTSLRFGTGDLNPHYFVYPTLFFYGLFALDMVYFIFGLTGGFFRSAADFATLFFMDPTAFYLIARVFTVILSALTVIMVYLIAARMFSKRAGLLSALFFALSALAVRESQIGKPETAQTLLVVVSFYFSFSVLEHGKPRDYLLAGLVAGLAASTKYYGGLVLVVLPVAHLLRNSWLDSTRSSAKDIRWLVIGIAFAGLGFVIGSPYVLLDARSFADTLLGHYRQSQVGWFGSERPGGVWWIVFSVFLRDALGLPLELLALFGMAYVLVARSQRGILLVSFPAIHYLLFAWSPLTRDAYLLPIIPMLTIAAGVCLDDIGKKLQLKSSLQRVVVIVGAILIALPSSLSIIQRDYLISHEDTRTIGKKWIEANISAGARIAVEEYCPPLDASPEAVVARLNQPVDRTKATTFDVASIPGLSLTQGRYMLAASKHKRASGAKQYFVEKRFTLGEQTLDYYRQAGFTYLITSSSIQDRYLARRQKYPEVANFYDALFAEARLVAEFVPNNVDKPGPLIRIYELPSEQ